MAAEILKVGVNRVRVDPDDNDKVESAITRDEIRRLIHEGVITKRPQVGISRGRKRVLHEKRKEGRRRGPGSRKGSRFSTKRVWIDRIRSIRLRLRELRDGKVIAKSVYRKLFLMAKGGAFRTVGHLNEYLEAHKLARKR